MLCKSSLKPSLNSLASSSNSLAARTINDCDCERIVRCLNQFKFLIRHIWVCRYPIQNNPLAETFEWHHWVIKADGKTELLTLELNAPNEHGNNAFHCEYLIKSASNKQNFFYVLCFW